MTFVIVIGTVVILFAIVAGFTICLSILVGQWWGAPYIPSSRARVRTMLALARLQPGECAVDLGSGNGVVVCAAAAAGANAVGVEFNPALVLLSRFHVWRRDLRSRARIVRADFHAYSLHEARVVFLYLWPSTVATLREKLARELPRGARIVSNGFEIEGWEPSMRKNGVLLYEMSKVLSHEMA